MTAGCGAVAICLAACSNGRPTDQRTTSIPQEADGTSTRRALAAVSDIPPHAPLDVSAAAGAPTFLVRSGRAVRALSGVCTHAGCPVGWRLDQQAFVRPCHSGTYTLQGAVVSGPPPRPLDRISVRIKNGNVYLAQ
jgi:cytochrome b6-f complex iron-sulfur subunit